MNLVTPKEGGQKIMRYPLIFAAVAILALSFAQPSLATTQWNLGVSIGNEGVNGFQFSVGEYYRVPEKEVVVVRKRGIPDEELPVVFLLATRARVAPGAIIDLRLGGMSWMDITLRYGLSPAIYYVPVNGGKIGPPYGNAYGHYKKHPKNEWKKIRLPDRDVVNMVNLKFMSEHYGYPPEKVMQMRAEGRQFVAINDSIQKEKHGKNGKHKDSDYNSDDDDQGKGKDKAGKSEGKGKGKK
jgi:hypothetical protein